MKEEAVKDSLRRWIAAKNGKLEAVQITDQLPIIEQRILTSLHTLEMLLYIEELRGKSIEIESLSPGMFRDLDTIYRRFFLGPSDG